MRAPVTDPSLHPDIRPDLASLRLLARAWVKGDSGIFSSPVVESSARLLEGKPVDRGSLQAAIRIVYVGEASFEQVEVLANASTDLAPDLWACAMAAANPEALRDALDAAWVQRSSAVAAVRLPLAMTTRRVLAQPNSPRLTLLDLIASADVPVATVAAELSALVAIGFFRLRRAANRGRHRPRSVPLRKRTPRTPASEAMALRRLQRDWDLVRGADDWTVIGANPTMDPAIIERACLRMLSRYDKAARDTRSSAESRELASRIRRRVNIAVTNIKSGKAMTHAEARLRQHPMGEGRRRAAAREWTLAARCFAMARKQSENAQNIAWLGWATYNDAARREGPRKVRALELLALAESMGGHASEVQLLRARADAAEGDLVRSWNRLERLLEQDPSDEDASELLAEVKLLIKRDR